MSSSSREARPEIDEPGEHVGEVGLRAGRCRPSSPPRHGREQRVLAFVDNRANAALDNVGVEQDTAVVEETGEPVPMIARHSGWRPRLAPCLSEDKITVGFQWYRCSQFYSGWRATENLEI